MEGGAAEETSEAAEDMGTDRFAFERTDDADELGVACSNSEMVRPEASPAFGEGVGGRGSLAAPRLNLKQKSIAAFFLDFLADGLLSG